MFLRASVQKENSKSVGSINERIGLKRGSKVDGFVFGHVSYMLQSLS